MAGEKDGGKLAAAATGRTGGRPSRAKPDGIRNGRAGAETLVMVSVSRAVARGGPLAEVLDQIAREAAGVVGARSASILLLKSDRLVLAASHGLSADYGERLEHAPKRLGRGHGPSGLAMERGEPVVFEDTSADPRFAPWRKLAQQEGYRALISAPLEVDAVTLGTLNAYRAQAGAWPQRSVDLLAFFVEHAASAIRTAKLVDAQGRQLGALERLVRGLREQTHEHANRIHAIGGLLALGDVDGARTFVTELEQAVLGPAGSVVERTSHNSLAGLLLAEMSIARQRGATWSWTKPARSTTCLPPSGMQRPSRSSATCSTTPSTRSPSCRGRHARCA